MRSGKTVLGLLGCGLAATALLALAPERTSVRPSGRGVATPALTARTAPSANEVELSVSSHGEAPDGSSRAALVSLAAKARGQASAITERDRLERDLLATGRSAATTGDKVNLRVGLERLLRDRPELAPGAARAFAKLDDRETLFVISRALVACTDQPEVRRVLDDAAAAGPAARREVALLALPSDSRGLALARAAFADADAAPTVRAAGVYALARGYEALDAGDRSVALGAARGLSATPGAAPHLRAESLHLLARHAEARGADAADSALARTILAERDANAELALAAASLALASGSAPADVAAALAKNPERACALAAMNLTTGRSR